MNNNKHCSTVVITKDNTVDFLTA